MGIPAYHWHWVATSTPPTLNNWDDGPLAMSVNFWWWPMHNDQKMEEWSFQNEVESWANARIPIPGNKERPNRQQHGVSFRELTASQRRDALKPKSWPKPAARMSPPPAPNNSYTAEAPVH